jgi:hypothetical protein
MPWSFLAWQIVILGDSRCEKKCLTSCVRGLIGVIMDRLLRLAVLRGSEGNASGCQVRELSILLRLPDVSKSRIVWQEAKLDEQYAYHVTVFGLELGPPSTFLYEARTFCSRI